VQYAIGIDLGGTHIKTVAVTSSGEVLKKLSRDTKDNHGTISNTGTNEPVWANEVKELVDWLASEVQHEPAYIGLCAPGLAATDKRSISFMPGRMAGLEGFDWTDYLGHTKQVQVANDAHAALMGEVWQGAALGLKSVIMLTLGTGVGGAILHEGHLMKGQIGRAGSFGHICLNPDLPSDDTCMPGSLENSIGDRSVATRSKGKFKSTKDLVRAAVDGDDFAKSVWDRSVRELACGIASLVNVLDPQAVIIGGGISRAEEHLYEPLQKELARVEWRPNDWSVPVIPAALGEWSGAFGAAYYAITET
jgi:glucokinase